MEQLAASKHKQVPELDLALQRVLEAEVDLLKDGKRGELDSDESVLSAVETWKRRRQDGSYVNC